jgi:hypothetical protein
LACKTGKVQVSAGHFIKLPLGLKIAEKTPYRKVLDMTFTDLHPGIGLEKNHGRTARFQNLHYAAREDFCRSRQIPE